MRTIAIEGMDGSGKTTVAQELAKSYELEGLSARVIAPYRLANQEIGSDIYPLWKSDLGAEQAIQVLKNVIVKESGEAEEVGVDILIFDRHWMTAFSEIAGRAALVKAWGNDFVPTAYLRVDPATAYARSQNDQQASWMKRHSFEAYATKYNYLCRDYGQYLLGIYRNDDDVKLDQLTRSIIWDMNIAR